MVVLRPTLPPPSQPFSSTATLVMPVLLGEVERRRQPMPAAADDDDVVGRLELGVAPDGRPARVALQGLGQRRIE